MPVVYSFVHDANVRMMKEQKEEEEAKKEEVVMLWSPHMRLLEPHFHSLMSSSSSLEQKAEQTMTANTGLRQRQLQDFNAYGNDDEAEEGLDDYLGEEEEEDPACDGMYFCKRSKKKEFK
jgi:hypothetical protein